MSAVVRVLVVYDGPNILAVEMAGGAESSHASAENNDIFHQLKPSIEIMIINSRSPPPQMMAAPRQLQITLRWLRIWVSDVRGGQPGQSQASVCAAPTRAHL
jgi:hypothetical protein